MTNSPVITTEEFIALTPYAKGYAVYMCGARANQPNVPDEYTPSSKNVEAFSRGVRAAILEITESE